MTNSEMADALNELDINPEDDDADSIQVFISFLEQMRLVRKAGGLHVIGSERHEARRIDNQLRGRSGRQGDPGSSRFYLSLEDDLMRMFGGERAENMMRFFKLDPSIPIESKIIGRLVEQAQERVEGHNFDIRKHLLDYDDILNNQRERIYSERDRVLVKDDLDDDVWNMLEREIQQRVELSSSDPDGLWKLLAFLDEIQPTIFYQQQNVRIPSFTFSKIAEFAHNSTENITDFVSIKNALLLIAEKALLAEKDHLIFQTRDFIQQSAESFQQQVDERIELLDIFFDNLESYTDQSVREISNQLQKSIRMKIQIDAGEIDALIEKDANTRKTLIIKIEENLMRIFLSRIIMTIEHRIKQKLGVNINDVLESDWISIENLILNIIDERFNERADQINQPNHPINQNIDKILKQQFKNSDEGVDFMELLTGMAFGTQITINQQTHQRTIKRVNILNYVFFAASTIENNDPGELTASILQHLKEAQGKLQRVWGKMEIMRLAESQIEYNSLSANYRDAIEGFLDDANSNLLPTTPFTKLLNSKNQLVFNAFGQKVQQVIYRHILLKSISELWIEHLTRMEALRISIRMEAYAQRDPLVQYKSYSTDTFKDLLANIRLAVISKMFRLQPSKPKSAASIQPEENKQSVAQGPKQSKKKKGRKRHKKK
jgi:preprotein translocase subunit SecA